MSKLLVRARNTLECAQYCYHRMATDDSYIDQCCYNLQQSIEFSLKFLVEQEGANYAPNHSLRAQLNKLDQVHSKILPDDLKKQIRNMSTTLESWEAESRYKDNFIALKDDVDDAMDIAKTLIALCETTYELIPKDMQNLNAFNDSTSESS